MTSRGDIQAGRATVEVTATTDRLVAGLRDARRRLRAFSRDAQRIGAALTAAGTAALAPLALATRQFAAAGDELDKLGARTGIAANTLNGLKFAAQQSGASIEAITRAADGFSRTFVNFERGLARADDSFRQLGLSISELETLSAGGRFVRVLEALSEIDDPTRRAGLAAQALGNAGRDLLPLIASGPAGISRLVAESERLFGVVTDDEVRRAVDLTDAAGRLRTALGGLSFSIGDALARNATAALDAITGLVVNVREFIERNPGLVQGVAQAAAVVAALGTSLIAAGIAAGSLNQIIGVSINAVEALSVAAKLLQASALLPIIGVVAGVAGAIGLLVLTFDSARDAAGRFLNDLGTIANDAPEVIGAIADAIGSGEIQRAFEIVATSVRLTWLSLVDFLAGVFNDFTRSLLAPLTNAVNAALNFVENNPNVAGGFLRSFGGTSGAAIAPSLGENGALNLALRGFLQALGVGLESAGGERNAELIALEQRLDELIRQGEEERDDRQTRRFGDASVFDATFLPDVPTFRGVVASLGRSAVGFDPSIARRQVGGADVQQQIADNTERSARTLERLDTKLGPPVFQ